MSLENRLEKKSKEDDRSIKENDIELIPFSNFITHEINQEKHKLKKLSSKQLKSRRSELLPLIKKTYKEKNYFELISHLEDLISIEAFLGNTKKANFIRDKQTQIEIKILLDRRNELLNKLRAVEEALEYEKVEMIYKECRKISNKLFMFGVSEEAERSKDYAYQEAVARSKAIFGKKLESSIKSSQIKPPTALVPQKITENHGTQTTPTPPPMLRPPRTLTPPRKNELTAPPPLKGKIFKVKMQSISIKCPICKSTKSMRIPESVITGSAHIATISIPTGFVCEHHFQAYVDKNGAVRGYQTVDFELTVQ
jgi:hypothetical protein